VAAVWGRSWADDPERSVLSLVAEGEGDGAPRRWVTAGELDRRTRRAAALLAAAGAGPEERVVWSAGPSLDALSAVLGALRLGAVVVPANPAYTERELTHVAGDVRPAVAVVSRPEQAAWLAGAAGRVLGPDLAPLDGGPAPVPGGEPDVLDAADPKDPALVVFTSGTTGAPKGAVLTHANLLAGLRALELAWRWTPADRLVLALPLFHVHGLCAGLMGTLTVGASAVVLDRFSPQGVLDAARDEHATMFFGVPTMYHRLVAEDRVAELGRLRLCVSGSAALPAALWAELRDRAGVEILERYGMSETVLTVSNPYEGERRPGTVGLPLPGVQVRLGEPGSPEVDEGQLFVRGPSVFAGYWERPEATAASFRDGWFATGDVMARDAQGYLSVRGRRSDLVISGGFNVYPAEVEDVLLAHPAVAEVAVTGEESEEWGETVVAWVVPATRPLPVESIEALAAERLAPYKRPRRYREVDALPRNALGKVQRNLLRP
jgi:malonyl-CoA/methylmalonyl-CoA synthetase